jgi:hypothetical protein
MTNSHFIKTMALLCLVASSANANEQTIYQSDSYGNLLHNKPSWVVQPNGQIVERDPYGNTQHQKPQYLIKNNNIYHSDGYGSTLYNKGHCVKVEQSNAKNP